ncbi:hypothetical protein HNY73_001399 [Argiope bruennichi]|uniref:Gustatory receptor n=1 Tax=Argiope bruennichi TaxID=94029 RepID=A0A8T0G3K4_ARGBR|nr:hypothetical protein HNY73_001399 [Argiope bruennichi]
MFVVIRKESPPHPNSLQKSFSTILFLLHLIGVDVAPGPDFVHKNKLYKWIWKSPKYIFSFCVFFILYIQLNWLVVLKEKRKEAALFFILLIQSSAHICVYRNRKQIRQWLENLSKIADILQYKGNSGKLKMFILFYFVVFSLLVIGLMGWHFYSGENASALHQCTESSIVLKMFSDPLKYCSVIQNIMLILFPLVLGGVLVIFTAFYSFTSIYMYLLYDRLNSLLRHVKDLKECRRLILAYEGIVNVMTTLDDQLSYSAFITVLSSMAGIFRASFVLIFERKISNMTAIYYSSAGLLYLAVFLSATLSASAATREGGIARDLMESLPGKFPTHYKELKVILRKYYRREVSLTLWKMYAIERSILISASGTLVTYGILIATLGNVQVDN